jgi:phage gpG-like protein
VSGLYLDIELLDVYQVREKLRRTGRAVVDMRPALERVANDILRVTAIQFRSQGRRTGGSWKALSDEWVARKLRMGLDPRIGFGTGALERSLTSREDEANVTDVGRLSLSISSALDYAEPFDRERPIMVFTFGDKARWVRECETYIMENFNHG